MAERTLVIGTKGWSSWSLRPWLALRQAGLSFDEVLIPLRRPETAAAISRYSPSGKVPVLIEGDVRIWDSLAICEYAAELAPELWPADARARAVARSVSAEMHAGFMELRRLMSMDVTARLPAPEPTAALQAEIARILELWHDCRTRFGRSGPFLFGAFSVADAMYAPVVTRFVTYGVELSPIARAYVESITALPAMRDWAAEAA